ncbi:hypothetical protein P20652_2664 [Pseudoalteromonas sp. BSi20652]|nr:hypothetical protein [Pseudoalteromonas sp. BSi20652]GAA60797.1 hypothetical protein P20652_2664 [Pseudoalteromonas sp. BSi20652]
MFEYKLPLLRAQLKEALHADELDYERTLAAIVRLMDLGALHAGNERKIK